MWTNQENRTDEVGKGTQEERACGGHSKLGGGWIDTDWQGIMGKGEGIIGKPGRTVFEAEEIIYSRTCGRSRLIVFREQRESHVSGTEWIQKRRKHKMN